MASGEAALIGTIAPTDHGWYDFLRWRPHLEEVNFWTPSAHRTFRAAPFSPFLFKLKAPHNAICGYALFARYARLHDWLAWAARAAIPRVAREIGMQPALASAFERRGWSGPGSPDNIAGGLFWRRAAPRQPLVAGRRPRCECFGEGNGDSSLARMRAKIAKLRQGMSFRGSRPAEEIGCILLAQPVLFPPERWIPQPCDWPPRCLTPARRDLTKGDNARVWQECLRNAALERASRVGEGRYGEPALVRPRLGQGVFRVAVTEAYGGACAVTGEHSLPALEAAHIRPFADDGPNEVPNGLLLRADLHRLFDQGYVTVTPELKLEVSRRLNDDWANGRSYYPLHGSRLRLPAAHAERPAREFLEWHAARVYLG